MNLLVPENYLKSWGASYTRVILHRFCSHLEGRRNGCILCATCARKKRQLGCYQEQNGRKRLPVHAMVR